MVSAVQKIPVDSPLISCPEFPFQKVTGAQRFPLVLAPKSADSFPTFHSLQTWLLANQTLLASLLREYGGILFRGFQVVESPVEFNDFVEALGCEALPYVGGAAPRTNVHKGVHTSNESPPDQPIPFHHEMAQVPTYPSKIFFYCRTPAKSGGSTPILRSDELYETVNKRFPEFIKKLAKHGVVYTRVLPCEDDAASAIGRGWKSTFLTDDRAVADQKAAALNVKLNWLPNGNVESVSGVLSAVKHYPGDPKTMVFFNSMIAAYTGWRDSRNVPEKAVTYATGEQIEPEYINGTIEIMKSICSDFLWEKNDVLCLDNNLCMHSRTSFEPPRSILAYVAK